MKKNIIIALLGYFTLNVNAQGTLPMKWDFDAATTPTGFSADLGPAGGKTVYTSSNLVFSTPNACRLDYSGEYIMAHWSGKADTISFYFAGTNNPPSYPGWKGTVTCDESADGTNWTNIKEYIDNIENNSTKHMVRVSSKARYFRIFYKSKASNYNLAVDHFEVFPAPAGITPEIKVSYSGQLQIDGGKVQTGNDTLITLNVANNSKMEDLVISDLKLSGAQASSFELQSSAPITIKPLESTSVLVHLTATSAGTHEATIHMASNDPDIDTFDLTVQTIKGKTATEPVNGVSNLSVDAKAFRIAASFNKSDAEQYLVMVTKEGTPSSSPADGQFYDVGSYLGNSRIVSNNGDNSNIDIDNIVANTEYTITVYGYNGYGTFTNYNQSKVVSSKVTTPGLQVANYYDGIDPKASTFLADLQTLLKNHRQVFYSNYSSTVVDNFEARDTTNGDRVVDCFYTGYNYVYTPPFSHAVMSREHCYPFSYMGTANQDGPHYSDLHVLRTVHQTEANAVRSNYPLNNLKEVRSTFVAGKYGKDSAGNFAYEPRDFAKGSAARANLYECVTYHSTSTPFTLPTSNQFIYEIQDEFVLKRWNTQYPPTKWEIARQEYIAQASVQGNRNPFVDYPEWACYVKFSDMSHVPTGDLCQPAKQTKVLTPEVTINVYPNPVVDEFQVDLKGFNGKNVDVYVIDYFERTVYQSSTTASNISIDGKGWTAGNYLLLIRSKDGSTAAVNLVKP